MLRGAIAAAVTPLASGGATIDDDAVEPYLTFLAAHGIDGVLALGTTGEGVLFDVEERKRVAELFLAHRGELLVHFSEAARACDPLPFYVYEFAARSGYAVPLSTLARLREEASNFVGLKVSDAPWDRFAPYLLDGLDIFVGPESLVPQGLAAGAAGAVSGLAASFPDVVAALVRDPTPDHGERVGALRASLQALPFHAASKMVLGLRGVPVRGGVRAPLRGLTDEERDEVARIVETQAV